MRQPLFCPLVEANISGVAPTSFSTSIFAPLSINESHNIHIALPMPLPKVSTPGFGFQPQTDALELLEALSARNVMILFIVFSYQLDRGFSFG